MIISRSRIDALQTLTFWVGLCATAPVCAQVSPVDAHARPSARVAAWVVGTGDNHGVPFAIIDKVAATVAVYDAGGAKLGEEPVLLGLARGDDSVLGIGDRALSSIRPDERTTPAGRFLANFGASAGQGRVLWVDFGTAISLHAVPTGNPKEQRLKRLASPEPDDNRITYGCINVSAAFYETVVRQTFAETRGVVYILPDTKPLKEVFPSLPG